MYTQFRMTTISTLLACAIAVQTVLPVYASVSPSGMTAPTQAQDRQADQPSTPKPPAYRECMPGQNCGEAVTEEDQPIIVDVLANDVDPDGDPLSITAIGTPADGTAAILGNNIIYTPTLNFAGTETFTYTVSDPSGLSATARLSIVVTPVNDPPVIGQGDDAELSMTEDSAGDGAGPAALTVAATDVDSATLTWTVEVAPEHGQATIEGSGNTRTVRYIPDADFSGVDRFVVAVDDGDGGTDRIQVRVNVAPVNDAPTAAQGTDRTSVV